MTTLAERHKIEVSEETRNIFKKIKENKLAFEDKFFYCINIRVPLLQSGSSVRTLNSIVRSVVNSKKSVASLDNRTFFKLFFFAGFYKTFIELNKGDSHPRVDYRIYCFSDHANLEQHILQQLQLRVRKIVPDADVRMGGGRKFIVDDFSSEATLNALEYKPPVDFTSPPIQRLGKPLIRWVLGVLRAEFRTFGTLYRLLHCEWQGPVNTTTKQSENLHRKNSLSDVDVAGSYH